MLLIACDASVQDQSMIIYQINKRSCIHIKLRRHEKKFEYVSLFLVLHRHRSILIELIIFC